ncbi:unnamed protein product [Leptidea sinapis]|uniref:RING-type domain-containing protein n=1 Tax=Leptidea sinapis TaxID=189913 RepID=A0A5E4QTW7_9NEOP|nr:unnamed protein product [Leptidea sinapis]
MCDNVEVKPETLLNLDDLLQCPVCYEIPTGQIFQCNEGHHVCGRCKMRLDVCPVCRAFFFGTRNYAMEELIANFKKLRTHVRGKNSTMDSVSSDSSSQAKETTSTEAEEEQVTEGSSSNNDSWRSSPPLPPKGMFRCLCCLGKTVRLPSGRLLNHLRYFHAPDLIESRSDNGEYTQVWQISTVPGRIVTAIRVADMGVFFLIIEMEYDSFHGWLTMASDSWITHTFSYTLTITGNDREAIFTDSVLPSKLCEGTLKKRGHTLTITGNDALALVNTAAVNGKLSVRRLPLDAVVAQTQPRVVLRIANRGSVQSGGSPATPDIDNLHHAEVPRYVDLSLFSLSAADRVAQTYARRQTHAEAEQREAQQPIIPDPSPSEVDPVVPVVNNNGRSPGQQPLSRSARRRMRQRMRAALNVTEAPREPAPGRRREAANNNTRELPTVPAHLMSFSINGNSDRGRIATDSQPLSRGGQRNHR